MKYKSLSLLVAACGMTLLTGCAASQDGQIRLGDMVNEVVRVVTTPSTQAKDSVQSTAQVTDWTFYLAPMQQGCEYPYITDNFPNELRKSVKHVSLKGDPEVEMEGHESLYTFYLQNAVAFGYPITKVEYLQQYEGSDFKVVFADSSFTKLRPSFKPPYGPSVTVERNDSSGYDISYGGFLVLKFDTTDNSITCSSGI
ncbi:MULTISPECIES: hypothetical protein [Psychrobacter]|uniref:Lipoprotein n=2 Tax=Psychrobacter TaxID=497 RepID=A0A844M1J6_9GAMM|nr:hypothetical protein [Psychrobacter sanguinis]MUG32387.1 hypothetical protein [Psychrobacter sanguinis]